MPFFPVIFLAGAHVHPSGERWDGSACSIPPTAAGFCPCSNCPLCLSALADSCMKAHFRALGGLLTPVEPAQCKAGEEFSRGLACLGRGMGQPQLTVPECEGPGVTCPAWWLLGTKEGLVNCRVV